MKVCVLLDDQLATASSLASIFPKIVLPIPDPNYDPMPWRKEGQLPQSGLFESRLGQGLEIKGNDASLITEGDCAKRVGADAESDPYPENGTEPGPDGNLVLEQSKDPNIKSYIQLTWEDQEPMQDDVVHACSEEKEKPKGILYDAFAALLEENRIRLKRPQVAIARDEPASKKQHADQRDTVRLNAEIKTAQDALMKKRQQLNTLQKKLSEMRAPKNSKNGAAFAKRRQQVVAKIKEVRDSIRASNQRIMDLREER